MNNEKDKAKVVRIICTLQFARNCFSNENGVSFFISKRFEAFPSSTVSLWQTI